ncbi:hypothetical protein D3C76_783280 [compost metagenome]
MAEGVAEIERRAHAGLALVGTDHPRLRRAGALDGFGQGRRLERQQVLDVRFEPGQERLVADESVLDDFRQAGRQLARRQGAQGRGIDHHRLRLVEGTDHVLAQRMVDPGLAPHRGIHLGQQRGRHLDEIDPALVAGGGEAGHVADHPATQGDQGGLAVMPRL